MPLPKIDCIYEISLEKVNLLRSISREKKGIQKLNETIPCFFYRDFTNRDNFEDGRGTIYFLLTNRIKILYTTPNNHDFGYFAVL